MTENEAINVLNMIEAHGALAVEAKEMAINALEEVQKYRAIGTPEECRAAMEKQTAKKIESPWCPCCGKFLTTEYMNKRYHCIYCGQLLEWEGER